MKKQLLAFLAACCFATVVQADPHCDDLPGGQPIQAQCLCNFAGGSWCDGRTKSANQCPSGSSLVFNKCEVPGDKCKQQCQLQTQNCTDVQHQPAAQCQAQYQTCVKGC